MRQEMAQVLGLRVLGWLVAQDGLLEAFLGQSGASLAELRGRAEDPALLCAVLDHVLLADASVLECAAALGVAPEEIGIARAVLGGGDRMHWT